MMPGKAACTFRHDRSVPDEGWRVDPRIGRALTAGLIIAALLTFLAWGFLALVHVTTGTTWAGWRDPGSLSPALPSQVSSTRRSTTGTPTAAPVSCRFRSSCTQVWLG